MKRILALVVCLYTVISFTFLAHASVDIEKILGPNGLVPVKADVTNIPFRYRNLVDAFGKMSMGCTVTHLGKGYVITAGHCFWAGPAVRKDEECFDEIEWGVREDKKPYMVSKCERLLIAQHTNGLDYALVKVSPVPPVAIAPNLNFRAKTGDRVTIFSHPDDLPLQWSRLCRVKRTVDPEISIDLIHHQCDTNPGSSGASIIDVSSLQVVGIHDGGYVHEDNNVGMNYGTYLTDTPIIEILRRAGF